MFEYVEVKTQAQLDKALAKEGVIPVCIGAGSFVVTGSASVEAWDSASVRASGSASVEAWGSASVRAWGSASVRASGSASVRAWGSASVRASKYVAIHKHGGRPKIKGGVIIEVPQGFETAQDWCDYHGVEIKRGIATLYKGVDDDFATSNSRPVGIFYTPGSKPKAPDWDGGVKECGGGLHFWPRPHFAEGSAHIVACPVKLSEIVVHKNASMPEKVKAPRVYGAIYEVDLSGNRLA